MNSTEPPVTGCRDDGKRLAAGAGVSTFMKDEREKYSSGGI